MYGRGVFDGVGDFHDIGHHFLPWPLDSINLGLVCKNLGSVFTNLGLVFENSGSIHKIPRMLYKKARMLKNNEEKPRQNTCRTRKMKRKLFNA